MANLKDVFRWIRDGRQRDKDNAKEIAWAAEQRRIASLSGQRALADKIQNQHFEIADRFEKWRAKQKF